MIDKIVEKTGGCANTDGAAVTGAEGEKVGLVGQGVQLPDELGQLAAVRRQILRDRSPDHHWAIQNRVDGGNCGGQVLQIVLPQLLIGGLPDAGTCGQTQRPDG